MADIGRKTKAMSGVSTR